MFDLAQSQWVHKLFEVSTDYTFNYKILLKINEQCDICTICIELYFVRCKMQHKHHALNWKKYKHYKDTTQPNKLHYCRSSRLRAFIIKNMGVHVSEKQNGTSRKFQCTYLRFLYSINDSLVKVSFAMLQKKVK